MKISWLVTVDKRGRSPLLGTPKYMFCKTLEWATFSIGAPLLGNMEGRFLLRNFEKKKRYIEICKNAPISLHGGPRWGTGGD